MEKFVSNCDECPFCHYDEANLKYFCEHPKVLQENICVIDYMDAPVDIKLHELCPLKEEPIEIKVKKEEMKLHTQEEVNEMEGWFENYIPKEEEMPIVRKAPVRKVVILCGCSGAGKTTYVHSNNLVDYFVCSADHYFVGVDGKYNFDANKLADAHAFCLKSYTERLAFYGNRSVKIVVDNTNTTIAEVAPYAALALAYGCELEIVIFNTHWKEATERNKHGTPIDVVREQYNRLQKMKSELPPWWKVTYINEKKEFEMVKCTLEMLGSKKDVIEEKIDKLKKVDLSKYNSENTIIFNGGEKDYQTWALFTEAAEKDLEGLRDCLGRVVASSTDDDELLNKLENDGEIFFL